MPRQCGCLGGNENCTFCHGSGYRSGPDYLPMSPERAAWGGGSARKLPSKQNRGKSHAARRESKFGESGVQEPISPVLPSTKPLVLPWEAAEAPDLPGIPCPYCTERFLSAQ